MYQPLNKDTVFQDTSWLNLRNFWETKKKLVARIMKRRDSAPHNSPTVQMMFQKTMRDETFDCPSLFFTNQK